MDKNKSGGITGLISAMVIFGTIGLFRKFIPFDSAFLAFLRGLFGGAFLVLFCLIKNKRIFSREHLKNNLPALIISGVLIGLNWVALFEAYNYTTVANATLCYYMAPVIVIILSPFILKERLTVKKTVTVLLALFGMALVSGVIPGGRPDAGETKGILFGLAAASLYAAVILINKRITGIDPYAKTVVQLLFAAVGVLPYVLITTDFTALSVSAANIALTAVVCIVHTGIAYTLYFGSMDKLSAGTVAIFGYIDPVVALLLSQLISVCLPSLLPDETPLTVFGIVGAVLIIGSAAAREINLSHRRGGNQSGE